MLRFTDVALAQLAKDGYSPSYGARPLKRIVQTKILTPIANMMISRGVLEGGAVNVDFKEGHYTFDVRKGPERNRSVRARARVGV